MAYKDIFVQAAGGQPADKQTAPVQTVPKPIVPLPPSLQSTRIPAQPTFDPLPAKLENVKLNRTPDKTTFLQAALGALKVIGKGTVNAGKSVAKSAISSLVVKPATRVAQTFIAGYGAVTGDERALD